MASCMYLKLIKLRLAQSLLGITGVAHLEGGFTAWVGDGEPIEEPSAT